MAIYSAQRTLEAFFILSVDGFKRNALVVSPRASPLCFYQSWENSCLGGKRMSLSLSNFKVIHV